MPFKKGDQLKQKVEVIQGSVKSVRYDEDKGTFQYLLAYVAADGKKTEGWFDEDRVEPAVQPAE
jgi:hypothetical protein